MEDFETRGTQPSPLVRRAPTAPNAHPPKAKPDARPMRAALGAGGLAAFSAVLAAIILPATPPVIVPAVDPQLQAAPDTSGTPISLQRPIQYVQLLPGQTAPPGAVVVDPSGPRPTSVVVTVPAPAAKAQKPIIIKTTQSGKVVP